MGSALYFLEKWTQEVLFLKKTLVYCLFFPKFLKLSLPPPPPSSSTPPRHMDIPLYDKLKPLSPPIIWAFQNCNHHLLGGGHHMEFGQFVGRCYFASIDSWLGRYYFGSVDSWVGRKVTS